MFFLCYISFYKVRVPQLTYDDGIWLPDWKYSVFGEVHSKALQKTVERFYDNLSRLKDKKQNGYKVGKLKWKSPREYHVFAVWLRTKEHEWSKHEYDNNKSHKDWWHSRSLSPTNSRLCYHQRGHAKKEKTGERYVSLSKLRMKTFQTRHLVEI